MAPDGILLVFLREFSFETGTRDIEDESTIIDCVRQAILDRRPTQRIVSFDEFRRVAFPKLSRASAPRKPEYLSTLLKEPEFQTRIASLRIRHVAFIGGVVSTGATRKVGECVAGYGGGGCLVWWGWDRNSRVGASILDVRSMEQANEFAASAEGTAWAAIIGILPIGLPAAVAAAACRDLGSRIGSFLEDTNRHLPVGRASGPAR